MKLRSQHLILLTLSFLLVGCVQQRYVWSNYDKKLYNHYKDPAQIEEFHQALKETLDDAVSSGLVPPGIYAEYGFLLYEQGKIAEAILFYQKEADSWPESRFFMTKMTDIALKRTKAKDDPSILLPAPEAGIKQTENLPMETPK